MVTGDATAKPKTNTKKQMIGSSTGNKKRKSRKVLRDEDEEYEIVSKHLSSNDTRCRDMGVNSDGNLTAGKGKALNLILFDDVRMLVSTPMRFLFSLYMLPFISFPLACTSYWFDLSFITLSCIGGPYI